MMLGRKERGLCVVRIWIFIFLCVGLVQTRFVGDIDEAKAEPEDQNVDTQAKSYPESTDSGKAIEGKGAKVLPILAKLQKRYESMNEQDKAKLLEKADLYRAKFKSALDKIDESTATKYGLNMELIHKILGLDGTSSEAEAKSDSVTSQSPAYPNPAYNPTNMPEMQDNAVTGQTSEYPNQIREGDLWMGTGVEDNVITRKDENMMENYDHLIAQHFEYMDARAGGSPVLTPEEQKHRTAVYVPGEDEDYKMFRDSMRFLQSQTMMFSFPGGPGPFGGLPGQPFSMYNPLFSPQALQAQNEASFAVPYYAFNNQLYPPQEAWSLTRGGARFGSQQPGASYPPGNRPLFSGVPSR